MQNIVIRGKPPPVCVFRDTCNTSSTAIYRDSNLPGKIVKESVLSVNVRESYFVSESKIL